MYSYIQCLRRAPYFDYPLNFKSLFDFVLFDAERNHYPSALLESLRCLGDIYSATGFCNGSLKSGQRIQVFYDVTRLVSHSTHSGISRVVWKLYQLLEDVPFVEVIPVLNYVYLSKINKDCKTLKFRYAGGEEIEALEYHHAINHLASPPCIYHSGYYPLPSDIPPEVKKVITLYDIIHLTHKQFYPDPTKYLTGQIAESCRAADMTLTISRFSAEQITSYLSKEIPVLPMPLASMINPEKTSIPLANWFEHNQKVLTFATQSGDPRKNLPRMLTLAVKWLDAAPENAVCIFGDTTNFYERYPKEKSLACSRVKLVSSPSDSNLSGILQNSAVYLYLSEAEGFGLPPLEAMRLGCPAVMLKNSSLEEVFNGWQGLVENDASDNVIISKICELIAAPLSREAAIEFSLRYSWDLCCCLALIGYLIAFGKC